MRNTAIAVAFCCLVLFIASPALAKVPKLLIKDDKQVLHTLQQANKLVEMAKRADAKQRELLAKFTKATIPQPEMEMLKPFIPIVTPQNLLDLNDKLIDYQQNLNNYLINAQVNMGQQMLQYLNPQNAQNMLNQINQTLADLSGVEDMVDTVSDFLDDLF